MRQCRSFFHGMTGDPAAPCCAAVYSGMRSGFAMRSIKTKILLVIVVLAVLECIFIGRLLISEQQEFRQNQQENCRLTLAVQSDVLERSISGLQRDVRNMAMLGGLYLRLPQAQRAGGPVVVLNGLRTSNVAAGGGIWFLPWRENPQKFRSSCYAYRTPQGFVVDPELNSDTYNYTGQAWYTAIHAGLEKGQETVWTPPYRDAAGTRTLMITLGCAIRSPTGEMAGIATMDWSLDSVAAALEAVRPTPHSRALFADMERNIILMHTDPQAQHITSGQPLSDMPWHLPAAGVPVEEQHRDGTSYLSFSSRLSNGMTLFVNVPTEELYAAQNRRLWNMAAFLAAFLGMTLGATGWLLHRLVSVPLHSIAAQADGLRRGRLNVTVQAPDKGELGQLAAVLNSMTEALRRQMEQQRRAEHEKARRQVEMDVAARVQSAMLPRDDPAFPDWPETALHALIRPAQEVGGDFYDYFMVDATHAALFIADVSGKGVPAAMVMVMAKNLLHRLLAAGDTPAEALRELNRQLCTEAGQNMFITVWAGVLRLDTGALHYANAGHNPPLLVSPEGDVRRLREGAGLVAGGLEDMTYEERRLTLRHGETLLLYTDGVVEATNAEGARYGEERLRTLLHDNRHLDSAALAATVLRATDAFVAEAPQHDDITVMVLRAGMKP